MCWAGLGWDSGWGHTDLRTTGRIHREQHSFCFPSSPHLSTDIRSTLQRSVITQCTCAAQRGACGAPRVWVVTVRMTNSISYFLHSTELPYPFQQLSIMTQSHLCHAKNTDLSVAVRSKLHPVPVTVCWAALGVCRILPAILPLSHAGCSLSHLTGWFFLSCCMWECVSFLPTALVKAVAMRFVSHLPVKIWLTMLSFLIADDTANQQRGPELARNFCVRQSWDQSLTQNRITQKKNFSGASDKTVAKYAWPFGV